MSESARSRVVAPIEILREALRTSREALRDAYLKGRTPNWLLRAHARLIDRTLQDLWRSHVPSVSMALIATGGYGRGELFPSSDVDVLVLLRGEPTPAEQERLERLIGLFWDIGLEIGHSVRTIEACVESAAADITIETSLLEARLLAGSAALFRRLAKAVARSLDPVAFLKAKKLEQEQRHAKHRDTPFALEPNLKEAPGGLRDLQVIRWMAQACGIGRHWRDLASRGLLQYDEARRLSRHETMLQDLRIRLHYLAGRREDRIAFDYQDALAIQCGYATKPSRRASEQLMQAYYRNAKAITQLNTILLQNLLARFAPEPEAAPRILNERFQARGTLLEARREDLFSREPRSILESFLLMQQHSDLRGMAADTLRAL
ncbi:MAG: nucleotidyltransferase domain-containing protein, partial [Candidatus Parcubacteria bacterium]|nr:nucleotidyltransferase domain-containing protein [Burkholderiales bacterium]